MVLQLRLRTIESEINAALLDLLRWDQSTMWTCLPAFSHSFPFYLVIVWRLRGNIIRTVLYIANVLPLQWAQLTETVHTARLGLEYDFLCFFRLHDLSLCLCMFYFTLVIWVYVPSCCGAGITNLNEPPSSFLLPPTYYGGVRSWLRFFKGHCKQKGMRDEGVIYVAGRSLLNRRCTRLPGCFRFPTRKLNYNFQSVESAVKPQSVNQ